MRFAHKIAALAALILILIVSVISTVQFFQTRSVLKEQTEASVIEVSQVLTQHISSWLQGKANYVELLAEAVEPNATHSYIYQQLANQKIQSEFVDIYAGLEADSDIVTNDPDWEQPHDYDARQRPWYLEAKNIDDAIFTDPYIDAQTNQILITVSKKFKGNGQLAGVMAGDIDLKELIAEINKLNFNGSAFAFLVSKQGEIISYPDPQLNGKKITSLFPQEPQLLPALIDNQLDGKEIWLSFTEIENLLGVDWYVGVALDKRKVMASIDSQVTKTMMLASIIIVIGLLVLGVVLLRQMQPLVFLREALININQGDGDLTKRLSIQRQDEFGEVAQAFNGFVGNLQTLVSQVKDSAEQLHGSIQHTTSLSGASRQAVNQQMQELEQLATAMNEMAATASQVAHYTQDAAAAASSVHADTQQGLQKMSTASKSVESLTTNLDETMQAVNELAEFTQDIENVLSVIVDISEQTNLLALNAAIEAARAGDLGRGFAVVADEVRTLASRTQGSVNEIEETITKLQQGAKNTENKMQQSQELAKDTVLSARSANSILQQIGESIAQINDMNTQIAAAAEEQSATGEEINRNTSNIRDLGREVDQQANKQLGISETMKAQIEMQNSLLDRFKS